jgi:hypothetical protein
MGKLINSSLGLTFALLGTVALPLHGCSAIYQQVVAASRQPGEQIATTPDKLWQELDCGNRERPFVRAESMEVVPEMIKPGGRVNYRLIYVMCPKKPSETIKTRVTRTMLFKGEQVARNVNEAFEIKPGRWVVDSFFTLPVDSPLGVYALEVGFEAPNGQAHKQVRSFVVSNEYYLSGR